MIKGFSGASIWSEDINNLLPFYRDTLGLKVNIESPDFVVFGATQGSTLALGTHSEVKGKNSDPARHMVGITCDDIAADVEKLKAAGVEFIEEVTEFPEVTLATFKDPEGNYVQIFQFP